MSNKYPGGLVTLNPPAQDPALGAATNGVWTMDQALNAETNRSWAMYDPYYNNVVLNLHGNGTNAAQNNTFLDSSSNNFTITRNGNTTQGAFNPYQQNGYWSNYFDGSSNIVGSLSSALGTGDFTVEFWVYIVSNTGTQGEAGFLQTTSSSTGLSTSEYGSTSLTMQRNSNTNKYGFSVGATAVEFSNAGTYLNQWMHIACVRSSGTVRIYMNGVLNSTPTTATSNLTGTYIGIGGYYNGNYLINAYITNFRATSTVVYSGNFTPPTTPLTAITGTLFLGCQSNRFLNTSSGAAMTINTGTPSIQNFQPFLQNLPYESSRLGGSGYFDGSGDYLTSTITAVNNTTMTIECWVYNTALDSTQGNHYLQIDGAATNYALTNGGISGGNYVARFFSRSDSGTTLFDLQAGSLKLNTWHHLVGVRTSGTASLYVDGVRVATTTPSSGTITGTAFTAGYNNVASARYLNGYMTDGRIVSGTAVYDPTQSTLTVPTTPLTAVSNTLLLLNYTNGAIFDNAAMNDLETVGNAQISTSVKKYGTGSMYFDGTGDYLVGPASPNNNLNIGDFTIEFWIYRANLTGDVDPIGCGNSSSTGYQTRIKGTTGYVQFLVVGGASITTTTGISATTWTHIAIVRSGTTVKIYINGTDGGGSGTVGNSGTVTTELLVIGANRYDYTNTLNGYIDDLRITKGVARYTGTFTPPTSQLQDQ